MSSAYLLTWNPAKFDWADKYINKWVKQSASGTTFSFEWSCSNSKKPACGDRAFLTKVGGMGRGVFAAGWITRGSYPGEAGATFGPRKVDVDWDLFLDPRDSACLLDPTSLSGQIWTPENSGNTIKPEIADDLELLWFKHCSSLKRTSNPRNVAEAEIGGSFEFEGVLEGQLVKKLVSHRRRERSLRDAKIVRYRNDHGCLECEVCAFDFQQEFGVEYAEVHHVKPLGAAIGPQKTRLDDLAVVCANCHRVAHLEAKNPKSLDELRAMRKGS